MKQELMLTKKITQESKQYNPSLYFIIPGPINSPGLSAAELSGTFSSAPLTHMASHSSWVLKLGNKVDFDYLTSPVLAHNTVL